jgi:FixJ family two-component response regulator
MSGFQLQQYLAAEGRLDTDHVYHSPREWTIRTQAMHGGAVSFLFRPFTAVAQIDGLQWALGKRGADRSLGMGRR